MRISSKRVECLVIGANGLTGTSITRLLDKNGLTWEGTFNSRPQTGLCKLDITDPGAIKDVFLNRSPRIVFHCANLGGGVDFCESNPAKALDFHYNAVQGIGSACDSAGSTLVFISSDYVFDGTKGRYKETDPVKALNLYGRLKFMAEEWIRVNVKKHIIIRTTNVFGWDPETRTPNYVMNLYRTIKEKRQFNAPSYLWGNPTYACDLAEAIFELYTNNASGVFHVVGASFVNRFEWAKKACDILELDSNLVREVKVPPKDMIPRPLRSSLDAGKFRSSYKTVLHDVTEGIKLMRSEIGRSAGHSVKI